MAFKLIHYDNFRRAGFLNFPTPGSIVKLKGTTLEIIGYNMREPQILVDPKPPGYRHKLDRWKSCLMINGFPKSGTMMGGQIAGTIKDPSSVHVRGPSTIIGGWGQSRYRTTKVLQVIRMMKAGCYSSCHLTHDDPRVVRWIRRKEIPLVLMYRDLRDVVVSTAHHIELDDEKHRHPDREPFKGMTHEEILRAVIVGHDQFHGIRDYWELYAGWLDEEWILPMKYEDMRRDPLTSCLRIAAYCMHRMGRSYPLKDLQMMARLMANGIVPQTSPTFRAGRIGDWRKEFTPELTELFEREAGEWIDQLGYRSR